VESRLSSTSEAIWNWPEADRSRARPDPAIGAARKKGTLHALIGAAIGAVIFFVLPLLVPGGAGHFRVLAVIAWSISGVILLTALISPGWAYAGLDRGIQVAAHAFGVVLTVGLMTPIFYLFFMPFRVLFRSGRRDRLMRAFPDKASTYWVDRSGEAFNPDSYQRQFSVSSNRVRR
jgi:hypothetical protein